MSKGKTSGTQAEYKRNNSEHPAGPWLAPRYQVRLSRLGSKADSRGLGLRLQVRQVKQPGNHGDDQDAKYQPKPYCAYPAPPLAA